MKNPKNIIISGPQASGKTHIANAIALTHEKKKVLRISFSEAFDKLQKFEYRANLHLFYTLIIIDECIKDDIPILNDYVESFPSLNPWFKVTIKEDQFVSIVYLTKDDIPYSFSNHQFHVINCNNKHV